MRLLCDEMLHGLGRWLRAAGHDTAIVGGGLDDRRLIQCVEEQRRLLLTCDRALAERPELAGRVVTLRPEGLDVAARELRRRLGLDWLRAPFTRCLVDNSVLDPAGPAALARIPAPAREGPGPIRACPACARVYWPGSHVRRMRARLECWQTADPQ